MAIVVSDLRFYASERLTDESDGGGRLSASEIVSGSKGVFSNLSDVDRSVGDVSIRKVYAAVMSETADKYLDAGVIVFKPPADPAVSVLAFSTGDSYDERAALKNKLESSITRGSLYGGYLWGDHSPGQRAVTLWQRPTTELPAIGRRLEIAAFTGGTETHSQVLWLTRITETLITRYDGDGAYQIRRVIGEIAEALTDSYTGTEPIRVDLVTPATRVYDTRYNSGALPLFGAQPLVADADVGDYSLRVADLYAPLIPTAFVETALPDTTPGGDSVALVVSALGDVTFATTLNVIGPGKSLFLGSGAKPGTVSITVSGSALSDDNGLMRRAGAEVGTIRYSTGVIAWADACPSYGTTSKAVSFTPAALPLRVEDTAAQAVTVENRGFVWVLTLAPIPAPATLRVSYRVNNSWYSITDQGGGKLAGADSSYGSGTVDFTTGTVVLQTGELPDVGSDILYAWGTAVNYFTRGGEPVAAPTMSFALANPSVLPGSVSIEWTNGATTYTLTDAASDGALAGTGGTGEIDYVSGKGWVIPTTIPAMGTEFTVDYDYGDPLDKVVDAWTGPALSIEGKLELTLTQLPKPGTLLVSVETNLVDYILESGTTSEDVEVPPTPAPEPRPPEPRPPVPGQFKLTVQLHRPMSGCLGVGLSTTTYPTYAAAAAAVAAINAAEDAGVTVTPKSVDKRGTVSIAGATFDCSFTGTLGGPGCALTGWRLEASVKFSTPAPPPTTGGYIPVTP